MSPVPPPAGAFVPSDDWTEDTSFDLSPAAHQLALPSSSSPSSSSTSSHSHRSQSSISNGRQHTSSPLRQSYTGKGTLKLKKREDLQELLIDDNDDFDFDFDTPQHEHFPPPPSTLLSFKQPPLQQRSRPRTSTTSTASISSSHLTRTVIGSGPTGIGTITKLGTTGNAIGPKSSSMNGTVKARALAIEKSWEADVDFDNIPNLQDPHQPSVHNRRGTIKRLTLSPPRKGFMPPPDALDELGFDLDGEDEDQATLKAGATIKAMLPPARKQSQNQAQGNHSTTKSKQFLPTPSTPPAQDPDSLELGLELGLELESDFALPLNLTNLTLATQPKQTSKRNSRPRSSNASTANTESWDSPNNKKHWDWGSEDSPGHGNASNKRRSETSATSMSDALPETPKEIVKGKHIIEPDPDLEGEEDDMELGLVLPSPTFFSNQRSKELNSILDKKRKPQFAPQPLNNHPQKQNNETSGKHGDDSFEDGLVLDGPGVELSKHRLREKKRARDIYPPSTIKRGTIPPPTTTTTKSVAKEREKAWEKQREQGWGRLNQLPPATATPLSSARERTQFSLRSNSASAMTLLNNAPKRSDSPALTGREKESIRSRSGQIHTMLPPPLPPTASIPVPAPPSQSQPTPSSSSRLRHQKSHYHIAPPQSPSLARKQSLASLQDALASTSTADRPFTPLETPRYHGSASRLTMPTSSSRAKTRPPITSIFPMIKNEIPTPSSSASSMSSIANHIPTYSRRGFGQEGNSKIVDLPKRHKNWGDGTELDSIDDLTIDDEPNTIKGMNGIGSGKPSRKAHEQTSHQTNRMLPPAKLAPVDQSEKRKKSGSATTTKRRNRKPGLIKHFGVADKKKVVGEMTWNPSTLRWEGNESILHDFDTISSSARPALITHYTGSSVGGLSSPVGVTPAPRIVGDMQFDPIQMKWVSILSPEDDEPDPFEGMADDEDDDFNGGGGNTITRSIGRKLVTVGNINHGIMGGGGIGGTSLYASSNWTSRLTSLTSESSSISSSTNTNIPSSTWDSNENVSLVSDELWKECKDAEERHKKEMKGWIMKSPSGSIELKEKERREEKRLWEIRHLAMKS
ncbi:uncharacterized protein IL334_003731 [Kwoniella shivajii]|uniref:GTPase activator n=1 Tax=Kwoniella shivajii TaxID=564305 RepID=A0ABZ1CYD3_9TREE|nr:hypothetical protein IL334_003731 [Kwoniella shivajii]